ncbi:MAG: 4-hydroxy-tetrahydrodipicolinate reductase [Saprospiraceae bacterium]|nr:4-hydroxy-tetrahydrodipicolinate reductase [Saprospiraceae bacterium]MCB9325185.1 4-hydroxy-tetrahydrodipicolinate reductase [Lewinellaceae bacterium]
MKIGIIGYGKMGKAVEKIAVERGHQIAWTVNALDALTNILSHPQEADVAIEFTLAVYAPQNINSCLKAGLPVASGTTGWNEEWEEVKNKCIDLNGTLLHASNFSLGMNIFFHINKILAAKLNTTDEYRPSMKETHHLHKKDHPSGTAITLAEQIIEHNHKIKSWEETSDMVEDHVLPIQSFREDEIPGTHEITWDSDFDEIKLVHTAKNRDGFALGAVLAAEFIAAKKGVFTMSDVLNL